MRSRSLRTLRDDFEEVSLYHFERYLVRQSLPKNLPEDVVVSD